ncbi:MAG: ornithine cyclodeaminase family protein, partial [Candidatus Geothermarchaeales archaeon]
GKFAAEMSEELNVSVTQVSGAREAVEGVDIVYATTRSREAVVMDEWVSAGMHLNSFGSDAPGKQEFDPKIFNRAKVVVDSLDQCKIGGDIHKPLADGSFKESDVYAEFGEIVNGWKKGREDDTEITVMDSTGLAALDVVTLYKTYKAALDKGIGIKLDI